MIVNFKIGPNGKEPVYSTPGAAGADIFAANDDTVFAGHSAIIRTELSLEIPEGFEGQIRPRSGMAFKDGIVGFFGTIDSDYRGEVSVLLSNISDYDYNIKTGDRIAQLVIAPVIRADFNQSNILSNSERGESGFGSTGK